MRKIYIQSKLVEFDGVISFRLLNPMFNDKVSYSFGCTSSMTPSIKEAIEDLHLPEVGYSRIQFAAMIVTDAFTFLGAVYFTSLTDESLTFQFNSQNNFWKSAEVSIRSLSLPFDVAYLPIANSKAVDAFPLTGSYQGVVNGLKNADGTAMLRTDTVTVPFPKFANLIQNLLKNFNLQIVRDELKSHTDIDQLYMFNVNSNIIYTWEEFYVPDGDSDYLKPFFVSIADGKFVLTYAYLYPHEIKDGTYLACLRGHIRPLMVENQFIDKVFRVTVEDEYTLSVDITPATTYLFGEYEDNYITFSLPIENGHVPDDLKNHLPEITVAEFLKEVENFTASRVFVGESSGDVRILLLKNILKSNEVVNISEYAGVVTDQQLLPKDGFKLAFSAPSDDEYWSTRIKEFTDVLTLRDPVATYADLPTTGNAHNDIRLIEELNAFYRYFSIGFLATSGWEFYTENNLPLTSGVGEFAISTKFSPLLVQNFMRTVMIPTCNKEGKFIILGETSHEDFRLFFHRGNYSYEIFQNGSFVTITLPLCNNDIFYPNGTVVPGATLALRWDGPNGMYEQLYKEWVDFMVNRYREETRFVNWPLHMLNSFAWWKKYRINHMNYFVKSIDLDIGQNDIVVKDSVLVPAC